MEKETLEEAAENHWKHQYIMALDEMTKPYIISDFIAGARWQAERMYSEEEVLELLIKCIDILGESSLPEKDSDKKVVEFFNRYKKK